MKQLNLTPRTSTIIRSTTKVPQKHGLYDPASFIAAVIPLIDLEQWAQWAFPRVQITMEQKVEFLNEVRPQRSREDSEWEITQKMIESKGSIRAQVNLCLSDRPYRN